VDDVVTVVAGIGGYRHRQKPRLIRGAPVTNGMDADIPAQVVATEVAPQIGGVEAI
jgi:hypothetical protein